MSAELKALNSNDFLAAEALLAADEAAPAGTDEAAAENPDQVGDQVASSDISMSMLNTPLAEVQAIALASARKVLESKQRAWALEDGVHAYDRGLRKQVEVRQAKQDAQDSIAKKTV